jgi:single-stranded DNA-binding protein
MYHNRVTLIGFLGKDAEVRTTPNTQARYAVLSLATKRVGVTASRASA